MLVLFIRLWMKLPLGDLVNHYLDLVQKNNLGPVRQHLEWIKLARLTPNLIDAKQLEKWGFVPDISPNKTFRGREWRSYSCPFSPPTRPARSHSRAGVTLHPEQQQRWSWHPQWRGSSAETSLQPRNLQTRSNKWHMRAKSSSHSKANCQLPRRLPQLPQLCPIESQSKQE